MLLTYGSTVKEATSFTLIDLTQVSHTSSLNFFPKYSSISFGTLPMWMKQSAFQNLSITLRNSINNIKTEKDNLWPFSQESETENVSCNVVGDSRLLELIAHQLSFLDKYRTFSAVFKNSLFFIHFSRHIVELYLKQKSKIVSACVHLFTADMRGASEGRVSRKG